ncbi:MAG: RdgB/HAM1 family non-canonical purine NTP pyrophosphatase [Lachnospiraceae bacterium]
MNYKIIFATGNEGKMREIRLIMADLGLEILSMKEAGIKVEVEETGTTFGENALLKAKAVWEQCGGIVLADDSGLVVDCLNGEPGIYSARYLGEDTSYEIKNQVIIDRVDQAASKNRAARFVCDIAAVLPDGSTRITEAAMEGEIAHEPAGEAGFGYDPILYIPEFHATGAQLTMEQKNQISHRGKALEQMKIQIRKWLGEEV